MKQMVNLRLKRHHASSRAEKEKKCGRDQSSKKMNLKQERTPTPNTLH
jgi:hypothetical protein